MVIPRRRLRLRAVSRIEANAVKFLKDTDLCFSRAVRVYLSILGAEIKAPEGATLFGQVNYTTDLVD